MEYAIGHNFIREPNQLLETGAVVKIHTHNEHHVTEFSLGLWDTFLYQPVVDGSQAQKTDEASEFSDDLAWLEMPCRRIQGGGPGSLLFVPKNVKHKFVLVKGPGFYRCMFAHRDPDTQELREEYGGNYIGYT